MASLIPLVKNYDMLEEEKETVIEICIQGVKNYNIEKDIAAYIKDRCDKLLGRNWHCIVGKSYGSSVTHEEKNFIYLYLNQMAILLFKSGS
ncbi:unnamed protein product [Schistosoma turkestanicum]|nr:unnamed protein product [Schistosoma turkestanicum]